VENRVAPSESAFLTFQETQDALVHGPEPERGALGARYTAGLDLGLTFDWSAFVIGHCDARGVFSVDVVRTWRGTPLRPVNLWELEETILDLAKRFHLSAMAVDQWQAQGLVQRLARFGVRGVRAVTIEPAKLDTLTTMVKGAFSRRLIKIPSREVDLREQLESLEVIETGTKNRRRDRLRFESGQGSGAGAHDDIAVALALALELGAPQLGQRKVPDMSCAVQDYFGGGHKNHCFIATGGPHVPFGDETVCQRCGMYNAVREAWQAAGRPTDLRTFYASTFAPARVFHEIRFDEFQNNLHG
jgi:hypothetical protein